MFPILQLGPAAIPVAPIVLLAGVLLGATLIEWHTARLGLDRDAVSNMVYLALAAGLIGARLGYVTQHLDAFANDLLSIVMPTPTTLDPLSGLVCAIGAGVLYAVRYQLPLWRTLDALTSGIVIMGIALGIAHLASGDAFGAPAQLPWSIRLWEEDRHPSQAYEILAALAILILWRLGRDRSPFDGFQFLLVAALFAGSVLVLEAFRGDSWLFRGWRISQALALGILALSLVALHLLSRSHPTASPLARTGEILIGTEREP